MAAPPIVVSPGGAERWRHGHPWIHGSDLRAPHALPAGEIVTVVTERGDPLGQGFWSPASRFAVRMITRDTEPLVEFYEQRPTFRSVDGDQTPDSVAADISAAVASVVGGRR